MSDATENIDCPLVCGGVYESIANGLPQRVLVTATERTVNGQLRGVARQANYATELEFIEGHESMFGWALVARPAELAEPISAGDFVKHENRRLEQDLTTSRRRVADLERELASSKVTDDDFVGMVEKGSKWSDLGRALGTTWQAAHRRFMKLVSEGQHTKAPGAAKKAAKLHRAKQEAEARAKQEAGATA